MLSNFMNKEFKIYKLDDNGICNANYIAEKFDSLLNDLKQVCTENREFSITKIKLEEACFFAKKAMSQNFEDNC